MKRKHGPPYFRNKVAAARQRLQTNLHAQSTKTGLVHTFGNIQGWEEIMEGFESKKIAQRAQLVSVLSFYQWLKNQTINLFNCSQSFSVGFRLANPKFGPLSLTGSISDGGRFNIGAAQMDSNFPDLTKKGALYLASSENCAREEAARPTGKHLLYKVTSKKPLKIWDLEEVINLLNYPNLQEEVKKDHGERIWAYQKIPTISQILASQLRSVGGDGLIFESTQLMGHANIVLFFDTDDQVKETLEALQV